MDYENIMEEYRGHGNVYFKELGSKVMRYWGKLCGNLFGTITDVYLNDDGTVTIETNTGYETTIRKEIIDRLRSDER